METRPHVQAKRLRLLIDVAEAAMPSARAGTLFCTRTGYRLVDAAFQLFECDELYDLRSDVAAEIDNDRSFPAL